MRISSLTFKEVTCIKLNSPKKCYIKAFLSYFLLPFGINRTNQLTFYYHLESIERTNLRFTVFVGRTHQVILDLFQDLQSTHRMTLKRSSYFIQLKQIKKINCIIHKNKISLASKKNKNLDTVRRRTLTFEQA